MAVVAKTVSRVGVLGLGYVGLPLAISFARKFDVTGFDISAHRIATLQAGHDYTNEVTPEELNASTLKITGDPEALRGCDVFIVTVPTPVDESRRPDFGALDGACRTVGTVIEPGAMIVFESTVYPGATEEICAPVIEQR